MEQFQCFECGLISNDHGLVSNHMRTSHNMKVECDLLSRKFPCSLCRFTTRDMAELKNHLITEHNKDKYNWMVEEIEEEFSCDECDEKYSRKSELELHLNKLHGGERGLDVGTSQVKQADGETSYIEVEVKQENEDLDMSFDEQTSNVTTEYKEKEWPTGYTFKSKSKQFAAIMNHLTNTLKSRKVQEINGIKFRTLNCESVGGVTEIEIEVIDNLFTETDDPEEKPKKVKGNAKVKIWSPNAKNPKKKDCTIMVDKIREHDKKFVKLIARKVVKPTIDSLLKGDGTSNLLKTPHEKTIGKTSLIAEEYKCDCCHMKFGTEHGMRVHKGRMHSENKRKLTENEKDVITCEVCKYSGVSADDMKKHMSLIHGDSSVNCIKCNYVGLSKKEVESPMLLMHVELTNKNPEFIAKENTCVELRRDKTKCKLCDFKHMDETELKRHIRDNHGGLASPTTSPPKKKTRQESYAMVEDIIKSLTEGLHLEDEMDFEDVLHGKICDEEEDELARRSRLQDEKIIAKRKIIEDNEKILQQEQRPANAEDLQNNKRKRKENNIKVVNDDLNASNDHRIPDKYCKLFNLKGLSIEEFRLMETGGGGKCGAYCVSLHMFSNTTLATSIRENINCHLVDNWGEFKESFQYPCSLQVGSGNRIFENDKQLRAFLLVDPEAPAMWMTHACLQAISNMQNMTINILTKGVPRTSSVCIRCPPNTLLGSVPELIKHEETVHKRFETEEEKEGRLQNARWTTLKPSSKFADQEKQGKTGDMFVLHDDNIHYSLMVHKSHDLFDRLNKFQTKSLDKSENKETDLKDSSGMESVEGSDLKKEVAKLKTKVKVMELEQTKTLEEMRTMRVKLEKNNK